MTDRRTFLSMMAGAAAAPRFAMAQSGGGKLVVYAAVGPELRWYDANVADATLEQRGSFHVDRSGRLLVAAHIEAMDVRDGDAVRHVPARLSTFRIRDDGRLDYVRSYDVEVGKAFMWWMGMLQVGGPS
jgi:hypothetical protein